MADILFHPEAQADYEAARTWYQARSERAAARFEAEVERTLELIGGNPDAFPRYDDEHRFALLRRFPFSVVYQVQTAFVSIVAVAHGSRSADFWQGRA
ncbi:MAG: type II toxin-antitoxin system RelE/ParE family toxin [Planctomycetes bacterium]|nr:type II toxin-antitoxin system RelE/ParE family toxin [Planctomycetota bacterium]